MAINRLEPVVQSALILGPCVGQETTLNCPSPNSCGRQKGTFVGHSIAAIKQQRQG